MFEFQKHSGALRVVGVSLFALALVLLTAPAAEAAINCITFHVTHGATGAEVCGVHCSDNTTYKMACDADIFDHGFDKEWTEGIAGGGNNGGGIGIGSIDTVLHTMQAMGYQISNEEIEEIETEVLSRVGLPEGSCSSSGALTVPMLSHLGISYDAAAVEAATPAQ